LKGTFTLRFGLTDQIKMSSATNRPLYQEHMAKLRIGAKSEKCN